MIKKVLIFFVGFILGGAVAYPLGGVAATRMFFRALDKGTREEKELIESLETIEGETFLEFQERLANARRNAHNN